MKRMYTYGLRIFICLLLLQTARTVSAQDTLYGVNQNGGHGSIFSILPNGNNFHINYTIPQYTIDGSSPQGSVTVYNGKLYGLSTEGYLFQYDPANGTYTIKYNFPDNANIYGDLTVYNGMFYGLTNNRGATGNGMIFSFDPTKDGDAGFRDLYD